MKPIVIIGIGLVGYDVVCELRKHDKTTLVLVITRDPGHAYTSPSCQPACVWESRHRR